MKTYRFKPTCSMKDYNADKFWIDPNCIQPFRTEAENLKEAITAYIEYLDEHYYTVSKHAKKNASPMYRERKDGTSRQCGLVFTAKTLFSDRSANYEGEQYIEIWTEIHVITEEYPEEFTA